MFSSAKEVNLKNAKQSYSIRWFVRSSTKFQIPHQHFHSRKRLGNTFASPDESFMPIFIHLWYKSSRVSRHRRRTIHLKEYMWEHLSCISGIKVSYYSVPFNKNIYLLWYQWNLKDAWRSNEKVSRISFPCQGRCASQNTDVMTKKDMGNNKQK